jgi:hypothetical protein
MASKPKQARFRVTMTATLTKSWNVASTEGEPDCTITRRTIGTWQARLATKGASTILVVAAGGGRVRFSRGTIKALTGAGTQSGTNSVVGRGMGPCAKQTRTVRCGAQQRSVRGASTVLGSRRKGVLQLSSLRGAGALRSYTGDCPSQVAEVNAIRTDLPLATGPLDARDFFRRDIPRFFVAGDTQQETTISGDLDGTVTERVRWTVTFTRLR